MSNNPVSPFLTSQNFNKGPEEIYPFGIDQAYDYREILLDTTRRSFGSNTNTPTWQLDTFALQSVVGFKVVAAQIPFTYYVINSSNNTFTLTDNTGSPASGPVTLPVGNYTSATILAALGTALTTASTTNNGGLWATYTVTYSNTTGKLTVTSNKAEAFFLTFGTDNSLHPGLWLGFYSSNIGTNIATGSGVLEAPKVLDITGPNNLRLNSNIASSVGYKMLQPGNTQLGNPINVNGTILANIPVNTNPWGTISYIDPDPQKYLDCGDTPFNQISMYLTWGAMENPYPVDLNGVHWAVKLAVITPKRNQQYNAGKNRSVVSGRPF